MSFLIFLEIARISRKKKLKQWRNRFKKKEEEEEDKERKKVI